MLTPMKRVLIVCTGNSARSQMAEALVAHDLAATWRALSAGTAPAPEVRPEALAVLAEIGVPHADARPKTIAEALDESGAPDLVVTVCSGAHESCPVVPGAAETLHLPFEDPAAVVGDPATVLAAFRRVRDEIRDVLLSELRARA